MRWCSATFSNTLCCTLLARSMSLQPTLIILATPSPTSLSGLADEGVRSAVPDFQHIAQTLDQAMDAELPVVLVASRWVKQQCEVFAPEITCVESELLSPPSQAGQDWVRAVGQAVQACPQAVGWLVMPTPMYRVRLDTLKALSAAVCAAPMVCPSYQMQTGYPIGFSSEFYSELTRLQGGLDLRRLLSRYPMWRVDVDDPGVLVDPQADPRMWMSGPSAASGDNAGATRPGKRAD
jgi:CTP:molybdopterin cytidylyltransferase MocA